MPKKVIKKKDAPKPGRSAKKKTPASNTGIKQARTGNKGSFKKGDKRINRKGRPKVFDELRQLAVEIAGEMFTDAKGNPVPFPNHKQGVNRAKAILLQWSQSTDVRKQEKFIAYAFGNVPQKNEVSGPDGGDIPTRSSVLDKIPRKEILKALAEINEEV